MSLKENLIKKKEDSVQFYIYKEDGQNIPSKSMNVFYNKSMELNRDLSNLALKSYDLLFAKKPLIVVDCMAASGIGSIRMLKDCQNIQKLYVNDINPIALELIKLNFRFNDINIDKVSLSQKDASLLLLEIKNQQNNDKPDVISIDPFGTPNIYMDSVFKVINKKEGLICITATDTAVLFGVRSDACIRKYLSKPLRVEYSKEVGARILLHFISRIANINNLGISPLLTFYSNHFLRIFALTFKNKDRISQHFSNYGYVIHCENCGYRQVINIGDIILNSVCPSCKRPFQKFSYAGPLWIGKLHNESFIKRMVEENSNLNYANRKKIDRLLKIINQETNMPISYYNIHQLCKKLNLSQIPKINSIISTINELKYQATRTHFDPLSIKTNMPLNSLKNILIRSF